MASDDVESVVSLSVGKTAEQGLSSGASLEHWGLYTDHNPIEITIREGRDWAREEDRRQKRGTKKADMDKVRGQTREAEEWKRKLRTS